MLMQIINSAATRGVNLMNIVLLQIGGMLHEKLITVKPMTQTSQIEGVRLHTFVMLLNFQTNLYVP